MMRSLLALGLLVVLGCHRTLTTGATIDRDRFVRLLRAVDPREQAVLLCESELADAI
jgi:hypothetical protein